MAGYTVARKDDYYSPLVSVSDLKATLDRWDRPSALKGVAYDIEQTQSEMREAELPDALIDRLALGQ